MISPKEFGINDKELFDTYFGKTGSRSSDYSFTNLFMWRKSYNIKYDIIDGLLVIFAQHKKYYKNAMFPLGDAKDMKGTLNKIFDYLKKDCNNPIIRFSTDKAENILKREFHDTIEFRENRDAYDYVYLVENLINLSGKKYHAKKNHINKFKNLYPDFKYERITAENANECIELFDLWNAKKQDGYDTDEEREAICGLFNNFDALGVAGGCIRVKGEMVAFSVGERLTDDTVLIHLEHADTNYEGAFSVINQQFLENEWKSFKYVNREEDMGINGLRKAKLSYKPEFMIEKKLAVLLPKI